MFARQGCPGVRNARSAQALGEAPSRTLHVVQVTSQCRVDAPVEWVRSFLLAGTTEDDVTIEGDVVEVRQRDRLIQLVVRNTLSSDAEGGTVVDVDANLRLLGLARIVGGLFHGRLRRTLERSLDRLPAAMEQALDDEQPPTVASPGDGAHPPGMMDEAPAQRTEERPGV